MPLRILANGRRQPAAGARHQPADAGRSPRVCYKKRNESAQNFIWAPATQPEAPSRARNPSALSCAADRYGRVFRYRLSAAESFRFRARRRLLPNLLDTP